MPHSTRLSNECKSTSAVRTDYAASRGDRRGRHAEAARTRPRRPNQPDRRNPLFAHAEARDCQDPRRGLRGEGFLDDDGRNRGVTLPIKVTVRVRGDVEVDLTGSPPPGPTAFQRPLAG